MIVMKTINFLKSGLDGAWERQKAISNNIANVDTPHYKRKDIDFLSKLNAAMEDKSEISLKTSNSRHISSEKKRPDSFKRDVFSASSFRKDENNVDIDVEMAELAKNNIYYNTLVNQLNSQFNRLKDVIDKGGR